MEPTHVAVSSTSAALSTSVQQATPSLIRQRSADEETSDRRTAQRTSRSTDAPSAAVQADSSVVGDRVTALQEDIQRFHTAFSSFANLLEAACTAAVHLDDCVTSFQLRDATKEIRKTKDAAANATNAFSDCEKMLLSIQQSSTNVTTAAIDAAYAILSPIACKYLLNVDHIRLNVIMHILHYINPFRQAVIAMTGSHSGVSELRHLFIAMTHSNYNGVATEAVWKLFPLAVNDTVRYVYETIIGTCRTTRRLETTYFYTDRVDMYFCPVSSCRMVYQTAQKLLSFTVVLQTGESVDNGIAKMASDKGDLALMCGRCKEQQLFKHDGVAWELSELFTVVIAYADDFRLTKNVIDERLDLCARLPRFSSRIITDRKDYVPTAVVMERSREVITYVSVLGRWRLCTRHQSLKWMQTKHSGP